MGFALHFGDFKSLVESVSETKGGFCRRLVVAAMCLLAGIVWCRFVFFEEKKTYNKLHPFTSLVPIVVYLLLRNMTESLRQHYLFGFAYLGRVTLETYILQFHIWMKTTGINGSPKHLLVLIPEQHWVNFVVVSAVYIFLSVRLSNLTTVLRDALIPDCTRSLCMIWGCMTMASFTCWALASMCMP